MNNLISAGIERIAVPEWKGELDGKRSENGEKNYDIVVSYAASLLTHKNSPVPPSDIYNQIAEDILLSAGYQAYMEALNAAVNYIEFMLKENSKILSENKDENIENRTTKNIHAWFLCAVKIGKL